MFAAQEDPGIAQIADVLAGKLGEAFRGPIKDLGLMLQTMLGINNKGVSSAVSVLGGVQNYGAPGLMPGGGSGIIGGRDVASMYAAQAIQRDVMGQFFDPVTGRGSPMARGLDQAQMGQAMALAMSSGVQYSRGNIFGSANITQDYVDRQIREGKELAMRTGNKSVLEHAKTLKVGGVDTFLNDTGKQTLTKAAEDAAAMLSSINDVMGSKALQDLEGTMQKLFGGSAAQFGMRAARLRMLNIQSIAPYYGEGALGAERAAAALQTSAGLAETVLPTRTPPCR